MLAGHPYKRGAVLQQSILGGRSGHAITGVRPKNKKHDIALQPRGAQNDYSLVAPIRQTASIFKQPVTVYKEHKSKVKSELKHVSKEKPSQLFWTKRLSSLNPLNMEDEGEMMNKRISLPLKLGSVGPGITDHMLLASISTHLHMSKDSAVGQQTSVSLIDKNPAAYINPSQPLMTKVEVSDEDICAQEERVKESRQKLALAVKALG
jgi:methyl-CpG-binding domain protein 2